MSGQEHQERNGEEERVLKIAWTSWFARMGALVLVGLVLVVGSYLTRSPAVLASWVGPGLSEAAARQGLVLRVETMRGVGLTGVRLDGVWLSGERGGYEIEVTTASVEAWPDWSSSLRQMRPVLGELVVDEATVAVKHLGEGGDAGADRKHRGDQGAVGSGGFSATWLAEEVDVKVGAVAIEVMGRPEMARFSEIEARVRPGQRRLVELRGGGELWGHRVELRNEQQWLVAKLSEGTMEEVFREFPVDVEIGAVAIDQEILSGKTNTLALEIWDLSVGIDLDQRLRFTAPRSQISRDRGGPRWSAPGSTIDRGQQAYELVEPEVRFYSDGRRLVVRSDVLDGQGGRAELDGHWHLPTSLISADVWFHDFSWDGTMPWPFGDTPPVRGSRIDGALHGNLDLVHRLVILDAQVSLMETIIEMDVLSGQPVVLDEVTLALPLVLDLRGGALSLVEGSAQWGDLVPFGVAGRVVDAGAGSYVFDLRAEASSIDAAQALEVVPPSILGPIGESQLQGSFGASMIVAGHTGFPDSLVMEVDFHGDVEVVEEVQWRGEDLLKGQRYVGFDDHGQPQEVSQSTPWVVLGELPGHIPAAVLAAEDATFFEHGGLDWKGLRMAMVENIEEGALVRGGSTITQQVAKNLFLTHDRTLIRKLQEAFMAWRVEATLSKEQILELYLNIAHWGPEIYGLAGAAEYFFGREVSELEPLGAAVLASILPNSVRFGQPLKVGYFPSSRADKVRRVLENMRFVEDLTWPQYFEAMQQLERGELGGLSVEICRDDDTVDEDVVACAELGERVDAEQYDEDLWELAESPVGPGWTPLTH